MNVNRLISEVQKRPALWDLKKGESKSRYCAPNLWKEVANAVGTDVELCKRKWKNLRDAYRAEVRRSERRVERDKLIGEYDANTNYSSKWIYFEPLSFINDSKRPRYTVDFDNSTNSHDEVYDRQFHSICDIKMEPPHHQDDDTKHHLQHHFNTNDTNHGDDDDDGNDEAANDMLFEEFQNMATPQAARRLSATISMTHSLEHNLSNDDITSNDTSEKPTSENEKTDCKCSKRTEERVHFLEDLEQEEQKLMQSTSQDIKRALDHVGDSDYNFLVSFLPQMKKMSDLQNLQFRSRMCDLVLNILAPTISTNNSPVPPPLTPAPSMAQLETRETPAITMQQLPESSVSQCCEGRMPCHDRYNQDGALINAATSTSCNNMP